MAEPLDLGDPVAVLLAAVEAFRAAGLDGAVYGGLALAAYGEPRETKDADLAVVGVSGAATVIRALGADIDIDRVVAEAQRLSVEIPDHDIAGRAQRAIELARQPSS
jgi:hypothetical protein